MKSGTQMFWKSSGKLAYEKVGDEDFDWWRSHEYDLDKSLKDRYGFKWTDAQVLEYYIPIMTFLTITTPTSNAK